eukprot:m.164495 g.164495  ORF g.164495 m.164495 type:complete len:279 (+) comp38880_c0_seq10:493-1329(+)
MTFNCICRILLPCTAVVEAGTFCLITSDGLFLSRDMSGCGITDVRNLCQTDNSSEAQLTYLDLNENNLPALPQTIKSCKNLQIINMKNNFIGPSELGQQLLISLKNLQSLSIESESLALSSTSLQAIHLENNQLTQIDCGSGLEDVCKRTPKENRTSFFIFLSSGNQFVCDGNLSWVCRYPSCFDSNFFDTECSNQDTSIAEYCKAISGFIWSTWKIVITIVGGLTGVTLLSFLIVFVARWWKKRRRPLRAINDGERDALVPRQLLDAHLADSQNTPY